MASVARFSHLYTVNPARDALAASFRAPDAASAQPEATSNAEVPPLAPLAALPAVPTSAADLHVPSKGPEVPSPAPIDVKVAGSRLVVLVAYCAASFLIVSCIVAFGVSASTLQTRLGLTSSEASLLVSVPVLTSAGLRVPVTLATRSVGGRVVGVLLALVSAVGLAIVAALFQWVTITPSLYGVFVFAGLLIGAGSASINSGIIQCSWWWPVLSQGSVAGAFLCSATLGSAIFGAFATPMINGTGIASLYLLWTLAVVAGGLLLAALAHDPPYVQVARGYRRAGYVVTPLPTKLPEFVTQSTFFKSQSTRAVARDAGKQTVSQKELKAACQVRGQEVFPTHSFLDDLRRSLTLASSWCIIFVSAVTLGCYLSYLVWVVTFFVNVFNTPPTDAGFILFGFGVASSLSRIPTGIIIDRASPWVTIVVLLLLGTGGFAVLAASTEFALSVAASIVVAVATSGANTCCYKLVVSQCPTSIAGTIGWMETVGSLVGFALPLLFAAIGGQLGNAVGFRVAMSIPAGLMLLCPIPLFITYRLTSSGERRALRAPPAHE